MLVVNANEGHGGVLTRMCSFARMTTHGKWVAEACFDISLSCDEAFRLR